MPSTASPARGLRLECRWLRAVGLVGAGLSLPLMDGAQPGVGDPLTVRDMIERPRLLTFEPDHGDAFRLSPDGKRFLCLLARGDLARNGIEVELITGSLDSLDAAERVARIGRLFSPSTGNTPATLLNRIEWLSDNAHVFMLWDDGPARHGIMRLDVVAGRHEFMVPHPTDIVNYSANRDGSVVVFAALGARSAASSEILQREGFTVQASSVYPLLQGNLDGWDPWQNLELFVARAPAYEPHRIELTGRWPGILPSLHVSPGGRWALIGAPVAVLPEEWGRYTEYYLQKVFLPFARKLGPGEPHRITQLTLIDLATGGVRPLWPAPQRIGPSSVAWSPDERSVLVGPVFLPVAQADADGLAGRVFAEVDVVTGRFARIPLEAGLVGWPPNRLRWLAADRIEVENGSVRRIFERRGGDWKSVEARDTGTSPPGVRLEIRQDLNTPAALYAVDPTSRASRMILNHTAEWLGGFTLGRVELLHWTDHFGRAWTGRLYYPTGYDSGRRYPLVLQTHSDSPTRLTEYSLQGDESYPTAFAAQPLANRGIFVLHMGDPDPSSRLGALVATPQEAPAYLAGMLGAIEHLVRAGLVDRSRIGLTGFSRTGWHVEYALTHSDFPFAAAIAADNIDRGYVQTVLHGPFRRETDGTNGAPPYGAGLKSWLESAPGFNTDKIHTPLRLELDSGGLPNVLTHWEIFSQMRWLGRPVEFLVIPDVEQGCHLLQNPAQLLASQGGAVDWYDFWLNDHERTELVTAAGETKEMLAAQYARWHKLREEHEADLKKWEAEKQAAGK